MNHFQDHAEYYRKQLSRKRNINYNLSETILENEVKDYDYINWTQDDLVVMKKLLEDEVYAGLMKLKYK